MCYPTPHELALAARALADEHPALARLRQVGASRAAGRCGCSPSAGSPTGRARRAATSSSSPGRTRTSPSAARRPSPWPGASSATTPPGRLRLALPALRGPRRGGPAPHSPPVLPPRLPPELLPTPGPEQPEWAPSLLPPDRLPPETRALTALIDELRPVLQISLHGTDLGGSWVQLTQDIPGLSEPFAKSAAELRIPVETGASDATGWPSPGPGSSSCPSRAPRRPGPSTRRTPG